MKTLVMLWAVMDVSFLVAQDTQTGNALGDAAINAVNPAAFITKLQVQPNFTWKKDDAKQLVLVSRLIQPSRSLGLPFIKSSDPAKVYTLYRLEVPFIGQTFPNASEASATGLSDMILLSIVAFKQSWGIVGVGSGLVIPVVNPAAISGGKWCTGVSGFILNTQTRKLMYGFSAQQFFSFAGAEDRSERNFMILQPILNKILSDGYFVSFSPSIILDWANGTSTAPIGVSFGKAFAKNLTAFISPQVNVSGPGKGEFTLQFQLNTMFPPVK